MEKNLKNILFINTGGGIGDALSCIPTFNYLNKILKQPKIYYYGVDLDNFWVENKLLEYKPKNLITIKNFPKYFGFRINHYKISKSLIKHFNFNLPFELHYNGELPARTGLGTSSAFTVGLCNIMNFFYKKKVSKFVLSQQATYIEQNKIKEFVGSQDQIHTSIGGINSISFEKKKIKVKPIKLIASNIQKLENSSILVFTGNSRTAEKIEKAKFKNINQQKVKILEKLVEITGEGERILNKKKLDIKELGNLMDESWKIKKTISNKISNRKIDDLYYELKNLGVYGGKILGAGGGGFLYLLCPKDKKNLIKKKLSKMTFIDIKLSFTGSEIISSTPDYY